MNKRRDGIMTYLIGISRSGKSVYLARKIEPEPRVMIWDPKGQYCQKFKHKNPIRVESPAQLAAAVKNYRGPRWIVYVSSDPKHFEAFCYFAFNWGKQAPCAVVCEELAAVTGAGKASGYWGRLLNQGLEYGIDIYATIQRASEGDKTIFGNITQAIVFRARDSKDRNYLAERLGINESEIPTEPLKFLIWNNDYTTGSGVLTFHNSQSAAYI